MHVVAHCRLYYLAQQADGSPFFRTLRWDSAISPYQLTKFAELIGGFDDIHNCYSDYSRGEAGWQAYHMKCRCTIGVDVRYYSACPLISTGEVSSYSMIDFSNLNSVRHLNSDALRTLS